MRVPPSRRSDEDNAAGCAVGGCALIWLVYAALVISGVVALVIILWKAALG